MHSRIIQFSDKPISKEGYIDENDISIIDRHYRGIDYVIGCNEDAVERIKEIGLPKGFVLNEDERSISFTGNFEFLEEWASLVDKELNRLKYGIAKMPNVNLGFDVWNLRRVLEEGMSPAFLYFDDCTITSVDFFIEVAHRRKVYLGGILDYHF